MLPALLPGEEYRYVSCLPEVRDVSQLPRALLECAQTPRDSTVLGRPHVLAALTAFYLTTLVLIRAALRGKRASFAATSAFAYVSALHNVLLCVSSLAMHLMALRRVAEVWRLHGAAATMCEGGGRFDGMYYVFLASKVWEYVDTLILALRGRPLSLLHVWHHSSVAWEVRAWVEDDFTLGVWGMLFNTAVHVVMYAYYACSVLKVPFPFKRYITQLQIVQFVSSFASLLPYFYYDARSPPGCSGKRALVLTVFFNASFLLLFIRFYIRTYSRTSRKVE